MRHEFIATHEESLLLIVDFQQAMLKAVSSWEACALKIKQLIRVADVLTVPILLTEQYSKGLGQTIPEVLQEVESPQVFQKEHFSACLETEFLSNLHSFSRNKLVVTGMEAHVCVLQTSLDLIKAGYQVHLVADAVASRATEDRDVAIDLLRQAGAVISSTEIVIFQWARRSNTDDFRKILPIVK
ncbi:MAG: isochorismatase family protein [Desulforhabdus sp.]|jgi:isochorismate hydrolase|nr:isochorismatase family protein [Desulforhabdus sp.]